MERCNWPGKNPLMIKYHDEEWGVPVHDDRKWFEFIVLDGFQAGLSWEIVLNKRENFRKAFDNFQPEIIAQYDEEKMQSLSEDAGIIRNKLKIKATVTNAKAFIGIQKEFGSFDSYIWQFTEGETLHNKHRFLSDLPATNDVSEAMSKALKKRGFKFVGSTICYAFMQAAGMVNDHLEHCFRYKEIQQISR